MKLMLVMLLVIGLTPFQPTYSQKPNIDDNFVCPDIRVDCAEASADGILKFKASVAIGVPATKVDYKWRVIGGKIVSGQGTEEITVKSKRHKSQKVNAVVQILGIPKDCISTAQCWTVIAGR